MDYENELGNLEKRNDSLKSRLVHEQLKCGNYSAGYFKKYSLIVLNEYKIHRSFFKVASIVGISQREIMNWYVQGQRGNPKFRGFYLAINYINQQNNSKEDVPDSGVDLKDEGEYVISQYGDGWSYKIYVGGEKIFIISNDLETLKKKITDRGLPID